MTMMTKEDSVKQKGKRKKRMQKETCSINCGEAVGQQSKKKAGSHAGKRRKKTKGRAETQEAPFSFMKGTKRKQISDEEMQEVLNRYNEQKKKTHQRKRTDVALSCPGSGSSTTDKQVTTQCESELPMDETSAQTEAVSCAPVSSVIPVMNSTQNVLHFESHNCFDSVIPSTEMEQQPQGMLIDPEQKSTTLFLFFLQTLMLQLLLPPLQRTVLMHYLIVMK